MKTLITILFVSFSAIAFSQSKKSVTVAGTNQQLESAMKKDSKSALTVTPNQVQVEKLTEAYSEKQKIEIKINELTEFMIGYKLVDVDSLRVENGQFKFVLKPKK